MGSSPSLIHTSRITDSSAPLVYLLHGRAGDVDVMSIFRRSVPEHWNILQVQAPLSDPIGGYSWWQITEGSLDPDAALEASQIFLHFREQALSHYSLCPIAEVGLGFSQGSGLLSVIIQTQPELFRAVGFMAGFVVELPDREKLTQSVSKPEIFWAHGNKDPVIKISRAKQGASYLARLGVNVHLISDDVEHKVGRSGMRELRIWLNDISERFQ